eukprot:CAMPEP_0194548600 /NCGR_PEP_ID=MMETSP0253-20130528/93882_1 /TAXON_ID=2966 /ORGANISM="Noctiluca scintillans" /LENGTH=82 /DNA_ID=CAMNT_0039395921 /DNA_START=229 /DNA_END=474 /DNA_ORIENTATION=-
MAVPHTVTTPLEISSATPLESPPNWSMPQVTTAPESFSAAKAHPLLNTCLTPLLKQSTTELTSPPARALPHATKEPSILMAA